MIARSSIGSRVPGKASPSAATQSPRSCAANLIQRAANFGLVLSVAACFAREAAAPLPARHTEGVLSTRRDTPRLWKFQKGREFGGHVPRAGAGGMLEACLRHGLLAQRNNHRRIHHPSLLEFVIDCSCKRRLYR